MSYYINDVMINDQSIITATITRLIYKEREKEREIRQKSAIIFEMIRHKFLTTN